MLSRVAAVNWLHPQLLQLGMRKKCLLRFELAFPGLQDPVCQYLWRVLNRAV